MGRAEIRRAMKNEQKSKTATYNVTKAQLDAMVKEQIKDKLDEIKRAATEEAVTTAMTLTLTLPLEVLMDHYWKKTYAKKIPEFTQHILDYFSKWESGELDMDKLRQDLWEYGGVRLEGSEN